MINGKFEKYQAGIFYIIFFLFVLAFSSTATNYDYDFWARLIAGMGFVQTGQALKQDFLSYTPTHTWYDHEWGSGVIFYLTEHFFSSAGILILQALLVFLIFFFISKTIRLSGVKTTHPYNFLFYYFAFIAASYMLNSPIRCQMFSFVFFAAFLYILELARKGENRPLYSIPVIMIVWNNLHGGCVAGIGLILLFLAGEFLNKKPFKKYFFALLASLAVLPINPWGFDYLPFLFMANTLQREDIAEWFGLFSNIFMFKYIKFKLFALVLLTVQAGEVMYQIISKKFKMDWTKFIVLAVTLYEAFSHVKLVPFAIFAMCVFMYDDFYTVFNKITFNFFNKIAKFKDIFIYSLITIFALSNISPKSFEPKVDFSRYPILPIEFIKMNKIEGNLLLSFGLGSYASYKLYPQNKIFMDGRYEEVYYDFMVPMLNKFYTVKPGWDEIFKKFPPDIMVIEKFYDIYPVLLKQKDWQPVFEDNTFVVFVKKTMAKKSYEVPTTDIKHYKQNLFNTDIKFPLNK